MGRARQQFSDVIEALEGAQSLDEVRATFFDTAERLGYAHSGIVTHVDPKSAASAPDVRPTDSVNFFRAPEDWIQHYIAQGYLEIDPVAQVLRERATPFFASDVRSSETAASPRQRQLMHERLEAVGEGLMVPIVTADAPPAYGALYTGGEDIDPAAHQQAVAIATFTFAAARRVLRAEEARLASSPLLTARERECLILAARGKSDWMIGEILGLSERTVHHAVERAKRRYGVATRVQAIVSAIHTGEISAADVLD